MNKKLIIAVTAVLAATAVIAGPHDRRRHPGYGPRPVEVHHHHHGGGSLWGHGGRNFIPGFVGGVVGGFIGSAAVGTRDTVVVQPAPVVVNQTTVTSVPVIPAVYQPTVVQNGTVYVHRGDSYVGYEVANQPQNYGVVVQTSTGVVGVQTTASRIWVPGGWSYSTDCYGVTRRVYTSGHYEVIR